MSEALLIAILNAVTKVGFDGVIAFLENRGADIDSAIAALKMAKEKSLDQYIAEDLAQRVKEALSHPPPTQP